MNKNPHSGLFITFEGPEGSGKTSQLKLAVPWLEGHGVPLVITREPGGTPIGEEIRKLLHDTRRTDMAREAEILLYSASRAQHVAEIILPALQAGKVVLCDRFYDSTYAYQGYGRGLSMDALQMITKFATQNLTPDLTLYLDISPEIGIQRRERGGEVLNRLDREPLEFHHRVRKGYLALIEANPDRWCIIDASGTPEEVHHAIKRVLKQALAF
ncbi:MAG: dTMP kinase [Anaerolineales bacterium]|nr:MAG: dTMP kinase [Anaerolineales bacterium]